MNESVSQDLKDVVFSGSGTVSTICDTIVLSRSSAASSEELKLEAL